MFSKALGYSKSEAKRNIPSNKLQDDAGLGYGPEKLAHVMDQLIELFQMRLLGPDTDANPMLSAKEIRAALLPFMSRQDQQIREILANGWAVLSKASEDAYWAKMRTHPLERLMVRNFAHLLAPYGESPIQDVTLSRRIIPAFFAALKQMMGPELMKEYLARAQQLVDQNKSSIDGVIDWEKIYDTVLAHAIINDILIYIAQYFVDMERRRIWMIDFFRRQMPRPKNDSETEWQFDDLAFIQLITALYSKIFVDLEYPKALENMQQRYGPYNVDMLTDVLHALQEDSKIIHAESSHVALDPDI